MNWASSGLETDKKGNEISNTRKPRNLEEEPLEGKQGNSDLHNVLMHGGLNTAITGNEIMSNNQVDLYYIVVIWFVETISKKFAVVFGFLKRQGYSFSRIEKGFFNWIKGSDWFSGNYLYNVYVLIKFLTADGDKWSRNFSNRGNNFQQNEFDVRG